MRTLCLAICLAGAMAGVAVAEPAPTAGWTKPVCAEPSHAILVVQPGRDVCGPTTLPNGAPVSVGFMPTTCPPQAPELAVDAIGAADFCHPRAAPPRRPD